METKYHLIKNTKIKLVILSLSTLLPVLLLILLTIPSFMEKFVIYSDLVVLRYVIFGLLELYIINKICRYIKILTNDNYATKTIINKNDERNNYIKLRTSTTSIKISIYVLAIACLIGGFMNSFMFYSLLGAMIVLVVIYIGVYLYFNKKY